MDLQVHERTPRPAEMLCGLILVMVIHVYINTKLALKENLQISVCLLPSFVPKYLTQSTSKGKGLFVHSSEGFSPWSSSVS